MDENTFNERFLFKLGQMQEVPMAPKSLRRGWLICLCGASLVACAQSDDRPRLASIGSAAEEEKARQTALGSGATAGHASASASPSKFVVTAGNILLGQAGASLGLSLDGAVSSTAVLSGSVTGVLQSTGQTLVELSNGASVLLNDTGGTVGDLVAIEVASGQVIAGPGALVGSQALSGSTVGGGSAVAGTAGGTLSSATATAGPTTAATSGAATPGSAAGSLTSTVTTTLGTPSLGCC